MDTRFLVVLGVIILGLGGLFAYSRSQDKTTTDSGPVGVVSSNSIGKNTKNVEVINYGDFQCPACGQFHPITKQVIAKYENDIKWTFRHFPLEQIHPNARAASRAAEAAGRQGQFFAMHDLIYENQSAWSSLPDPRALFEQYAQQLNLDVAKFKTDYASSSTNSTINADKEEGTKKGVSGTPTFFINGEQMKNEDLQSLEAFSAKIDEAIKKASGQQ